MPVGAAIGAAGAIGGGIASGKGAKKVAQIQADASAKQTAALQAMYETNKSLMTPTFDRGEAAAQQQQALLGLSGDPTAALKTLEATPGYQFASDQAMRATASNAYARGMGNSGAALKALQDRANGLATTNYNTYVNQLGSVADRGVTAMNGLVAQGNATTSAANALAQSNADSQSANAVFQGNNLANVLKGVAGSAGSAFGSSYQGSGLIQPSVNVGWDGRPNPGHAMSFNPDGSYGRIGL